MKLIAQDVAGGAQRAAIAISFAQKARLDRDQIASLTHGYADDPCWTEEVDRLLIRAVDALCV